MGGTPSQVPAGKQDVSAQQNTLLRDPTNNANGKPSFDCTVINATANIRVPFATSVKQRSRSISYEAETSLRWGELDVNSPPSAMHRVPTEMNASDAWRDATSLVDAPSSVKSHSGTDVNVGGTMIHLEHVPTELTASIAPMKIAEPSNFSFTAVGGQSGALRSLACSADGANVACVVAGSKNVQYVDGQTGQFLVEIKGAAPVVALAHSRDGKFLVTSSADGTVCLWDLNNTKKLREIPITSQANAIAINEECDTVATSSTEDFVTIWDSKTCEPLTTFQHHSGSVSSVAFSRRGGLVASGGANGEIFVWSATTGDVRMRAENGQRTQVTVLSFSLDATRLLSADRDVLQVWDLFTESIVFTRTATGNVHIAAAPKCPPAPDAMTPRFTCSTFTAGNLIVAGLTSRKVMVFDPNKGTELLWVETRGLVTCMCPTRNADRIFVGDFIGNQYRLELQFKYKDVLDFNIHAKPLKERIRVD